MFRRRLAFGRPLVRRPLMGATLAGGLGYLVGRRRSAQATPATEQSPDDRLRELERLHVAGTITDEEFAAKRADILREL